MTSSFSEHSFIAYQSKGGCMKKLLAAVLVLGSLGSYANGMADRNVKAPTQLDDLIRGEMSAVESYDKILKDIKDPAEKKKLVKIRDNHENAVSKLKGFSTTPVLEDTESSGAWGAFTSAWTGGAKLMGNETALKALKQGEEHGINEYDEALRDPSIRPEVKKTIETQLLPSQKEHIKTINDMM